MEGPYLQDLRSILVAKYVVTSTNKPTWPHHLYSSKFQYLLLHQCNVECAWEEILSQYRSFMKKFFPTQGRLLGYRGSHEGLTYDFFHF